MGSTGSIGTQTLDVVRAQREQYHVVGLTARSNVDAILQQTLEFKPAFVVLADEAARERLAAQLRDQHIATRLLGPDELPATMRTSVYDLCVVATAGTEYLQLVLDTLRNGSPIAIASKEVIIALGDLLVPFREQLYPIDSELSAVWQCLKGEDPEAVERVILTASGGPFRQLPAEDLVHVRAKDALMHPSWTMGPKVTVDSATLFNKSLELAEAHILFGFSWDIIDAVQHPQSIIHAMIEFHDGTTRAVLYRPDMRAAIAYALSYPERLVFPQAQRLRPELLQGLEFEPIDPKFVAYAIGRQAGHRSPRAMLGVLGADDVAVEQFLDERGSFVDIAAVLRHVLEHVGDEPLDTTVQSRIDALEAGRCCAEKWYEARSGRTA